MLHLFSICLCGLAAGYVQGGRRWRRDTCGFIFGSWCFARATHSGSHTGPDNPRKHCSHCIRTHSGWSRRHWEPLAKLGQTRAQHSMTTTPPRFVIGEALGVGAFGVVCTAWDSRNQAWVAVKRATTPAHLPTHLVERSLMMEAYISTHLRHESECTQCTVRMESLSSLQLFETHPHARSQISWAQMRRCTLHSTATPCSW